MAEPEPVMKAMEAENLDIGYTCGLFNNNKIILIKGLSAVFEKGHLIYVNGRNGYGKSSLLRNLSLLHIPFEGKIKWWGDPVWEKNVGITEERKRELRRIRSEKIGYIFQSLRLFDDMSARENIWFPVNVNKKNGASEERFKGQYDYLKKELALEKFEKEKVGNLSGGQKQRVAIARALITDPEILFADEPWTSLDSTMKQNLIDIFFDMVKKGKTVVVVCHDQLLPWFDGKTKVYAIEAIEGAEEPRRLVLLNHNSCEQCSNNHQHPEQDKKDPTIYAIILGQGCKECECRIKYEENLCDL